MGARAMWKAELSVGEHTVPVKLYSAVEDRAVHFRLLDAQARAPVEQQMYDPSTGGPPEGPPRKGVPLDEGTFVMLAPEELAALEPPESRTIAVERFVPPSAIDEAWYDRPYWLGPDGDDAGYFALVEALSGENVIGIAHWVMRKNRAHGALRVNGRHLMLIRMRHTEEVVPASVLTAPSGRQADPREVALASQLVAALEGPFDPHEIESTYDDRVRELVEAKAAGRIISFPQAAVRDASEDSLASILEASLKKMGGAHG